MSVSGANLLNYFFTLAIGIPLGLVCGIVSVGTTASFRTTPLKDLILPLLATWLVLLCIPLLVVSTAALFVTNCDYLSGLLFFALGPALGALYMSALGLMLGSWLPRKWAVISIVLWVVGTVGWNLLHFYNSPQIFAYNPIIGFYSGTIYDEVIEISSTYLNYRAGTLSQIALFIVIAAIKRTPSRHRILLALASLLFLLQCGLFAYRAVLGTEISAVHIQAQLGGQFETEHFIIHYPKKNLSSQRIEALAQDHEFRFHQLTALLGVSPTEKIRSYIYAGPAQKRALMGADRTYIAKPWQGAIHLHKLNYGAPVLKHELAHVFGAQINRDLLAIPTLAGLIPKMAIVEGLAVAATWIQGRLTLHQWSAAMVDLGMAPPLSQLIDSSNFLGLNASMAYTLSGSFLRFLLDTYGLEKLQTLYKHGEFEGVYESSLAELSQQWEDFVTNRKKVPLTERDMQEARARFDVPSVFHRVCALEVAKWERQAASAGSDGNYADALSLYQRVADSNPQDPTKWWHLLRTHIQLKQFEKATELARQLTRSEKAGAVLKNRASLKLVDLLWRQGNTSEAESVLEGLANSALSEAELRGIEVRQQTLTWQNPDAAGNVRDYLFSTQPSHRLAIAGLEAWTIKWPTQPIFYYLLARRLAANNQVDAAIEALEKTLLNRIQSDILIRETHRLLGVLLLNSGQSSQAETHFKKAKQLFTSRGFKALMQDWIERARWTEAQS